MCRATRVVRSGDTVYFRASKYFPVPTADSRQVHVREGYIPFFGVSKCAFKKKNYSTQ